jgi:hypothetical protein
MRVENWTELDTEAFGLFYDSSARKKKESWGTEAILNTVILAFDDRIQGRSSPSDGTKQAFSNLWEIQVQTGDHQGTWDWLDFNMGPWEWKEARYFGASLAAIAVGTAPGYYTPGTDADTDARVTLLRDYLKDGPQRQDLHNRVWDRPGVEGSRQRPSRRAFIRSGLASSTMTAVGACPHSGLGSGATARRRRLDPTVTQPALSCMSSRLPACQKAT